jgi:beta-phosphoglucomutase-like phosphatase (HAD superfamily)
MIEAVVFDLDGILIDSEHVWDEVRQQLTVERGGTWNDSASRDMMGMSSIEWSRYMRDVVGLAEEPEEISTEVVRRLEERYRRELPMIAGAESAVERLAERWPLALASSSNRELIDLAARRSRTPRKAFSPRRPPGCARSRFPTRSTRRTRTRSRRPMPSSQPSRT